MESLDVDLCQTSVPLLNIVSCYQSTLVHKKYYHSKLTHTHTQHSHTLYSHARAHTHTRYTPAHTHTHTLYSHARAHTHTRYTPAHTHTHTILMTHTRTFASHSTDTSYLLVSLLFFPTVSKPPNSVSTTHKQDVSSSNNSFACASAAPVT